MTARKRKESGSSKYPMPRSEDRNVYAEAPIAPPAPICARTRKPAIARKKIALTLRIAPEEIYARTDTPSVFWSLLFDLPPFSRSDFFPPFAAIYRVSAHDTTRACAFTARVLCREADIASPACPLYTFKDSIDFGQFKDKYKSYYGRDKGHKNRSLLEISRQSYHYEPLWKK